MTLDGTAVADVPVVANRRGTSYASNEATHIALTEGRTIIGRPVVGRVLRDPNDAAISKMIIALADSMGLAVIAEGVEVPGQCDFLATHGCHAYQGYLFSRPLPASEIRELVRRSPPQFFLV